MQRCVVNEVEWRAAVVPSESELDHHIGEEQYLLVASAATTSSASILRCEACSPTLKLTGVFDKLAM